MPACHAWGTTAADLPLGPLTIVRRDLRPEDVAIDLTYCGVCHSDLHAARNDWGRTRYPFVPGHEIVGTVSAVGSGVTKFAPGDTVAVGTIVDSCRRCDACTDGEEQYCREGMVGTYNGTDRIDGTTTYGGYSKTMVVAEPYLLRIPKALIPPAPRRCCAPGSPAIRRSSTGASGRAARSGSSAWVVWATWESSSRTLWGRRSR